MVHILGLFDVHHYACICYYLVLVLTCRPASSRNNRATGSQVCGVPQQRWCACGTGPVQNTGRPGCHQETQDFLPKWSVLEGIVVQYVVLALLVEYSSFTRYHYHYLYIPTSGYMYLQVLMWTLGMCWTLTLCVDCSSFTLESCGCLWSLEDHPSLSSFTMSRREM